MMKTRGFSCKRQLLQSTPTKQSSATLQAEATQSLLTQIVAPRFTIPTQYHSQTSNPLNTPVDATALTSRSRLCLAMLALSVLQPHHVAPFAQVKLNILSKRNWRIILILFHSECESTHNICSSSSLGYWGHRSLTDPPKKLDTGYGLGLWNEIPPYTHHTDSMHRPDTYPGQ